MSKIRLRQLEVFHAIMDCGTVGAAAQQLGTSQPTASRVLSDLEDVIGFKLFQRRSNRLLPSPEAHALFREVQANYICLDQLDRMAKRLATTEAGTLRIAAAPSVSISLLPAAIRTFLKTRPDVHVQLEVHAPEAVLDCVQNRDFDLGITAVTEADDSFDIAPLCQVEAVCILLEDSSLASKTVIHPADLHDQPFISLGHPSESRRKIDGVLGSSGVRPLVLAETQTASVACALVNQGIGMSILDFLTFSVISKPPLVCRTFRPRIIIDFITVKPRFRPNARLTYRFEEVLQNTITGHSAWHAPDLTERYGLFEGRVLEASFKR